MVIPGVVEVEVPAGVDAGPSATEAVGEEPRMTAIGTMLCVTTVVGLEVSVTVGVTGQTVVDTGMMTVVRIVERAGQLVISGPQLTIVYANVE
jgi:hypothetical protein